MTAIKILIIEDEAIIAENLRMILEYYGYDVVDIAARYEEAIIALDKYKLDFVLLDITIKGEKDGIELAHFINENLSKILKNLLQTGWHRSHEVKITREERRQLLTDLLNFYRLHLDNFPEINSLKILQEIFWLMMNEERWTMN